MKPIKIIKKRLAAHPFTSLELAALLHQCPPDTDKVIKVRRRSDHVLSVYSPEEFEALFGIPYLPYLTFTSEELLRITIGQCPWIFRFGLLGMEDDDRYGRYLAKIQSGFVADVTIGWIDDTLGYGLYSNSNLSKGDFIGAYTGVVRPLSKEVSDRNVYCLHYPTRWWSLWMLAVDAGKGGNEMRFANHSQDGNMSLECLYDRGLLHFFFIAQTPICKGEPLSFDYGEDFWRFRRALAQDVNNRALGANFQYMSDPVG